MLEGIFGCFCFVDGRALPGPPLLGYPMAVIILAKRLR
jgi:hypothetical protein